MNQSPLEELQLPIVELRQYTLYPGRMGTLVALFESEFIETQEAAGMKVIGQFCDLDKPDRFVWIRAFSPCEITSFAKRCIPMTLSRSGTRWPSSFSRNVAMLTAQVQASTRRPHRLGSSKASCCAMGTTLRVTEHRGRVDAQVLEQTRQIGCELRGIRRRKSPTSPVATKVGNDHAMPSCEMLDDRLEHLAGDHRPVHEQERRPRSSLGEGEEFHDYSSFSSSTVGRCLTPRLTWTTRTTLAV